MQNKYKLLKKLLNSMAEEYYSYKNQIIKINNLKETDFKRAVYKIEDSDKLKYEENQYLVDQNNIYFNKESVNLLKYKIEFLEKIKKEEFYIPKYNNNLYKNLSIDLNKGLDLLKKYQKSNHEQASFLHYKSDLLDYLPVKRRKLLLNLGAEADKMGYNLYLVGGQVRDLLYNLPLNKDLDILLDGDLKKFFNYLAEEYGYEYDYNTKFSTGFLHNKYGFSIDIASCREEKYHFPGSLPLVEKADLFSDLFRRDFTINTLVIDLNPKRKGILYDFFGSLYDLKNRMLKVLHNYSFRDDPLRILRGIRFQILKDFRLSAETVELSKKSLKNYDYHKLSLERVFGELAYLFKARKNISQFSSILLNQIPVLKLIEDDYHFDNHLDAEFLKAEKILSLSRQEKLEVNHFLVRLIVLFYNSKESTINSWPLSIFEKKIFNHKNWEKIDKKIFLLEDPAEKFRKLEDFKAEELIVFLIKNYRQDFIKDIFSHLKQREEIDIPINGHDLIKMGVEEGPEIKELLFKVRDQILRNNLRSKQEALDYIKDLI